MQLVLLTKMFGTTTDDLLSEGPIMLVRLMPEHQRKSIDDLVFRVIVNSSTGDKVRVNLPLPIVKLEL